VSFLHSKESKDATSRKAKRAKETSSTEHVASYDEAMSWNHGLGMWSGAGLDQFLEDAPELDETKVPKGFFITLDRMQTQWCVVWFLRNHSRMIIEVFFDSACRHGVFISFGGQHLVAAVIFVNCYDHDSGIG
jgi:hypothetical protein